MLIVRLYSTFLSRLYIYLPRTWHFYNQTILYSSVNVVNVLQRLIIARESIYFTMDQLMSPPKFSIPWTDLDRTFI